MAPITLIWHVCILLDAIVYLILSIHMIRKYFQERLVFSFWVMIFFIIMTTGFGIIFWVYLPVTDSSEVTGPIAAVSGVATITGSAVLFSVGLILLEREKLIPIPLIIGIGMAVLALLTSFDPSLATAERIISIIGTLIFVIPTVILFFYLYVKTKSTKSLAFSVGMLVQLIAGFSNIFSPDYFAILSFVSGIIIFLGIAGVLDKVLPSTSPEGKKLA